MLSDDSAYADRDQIDPDDPVMVGYWAARWGVSRDVIITAIQNVGILISDIAPEIWKSIPVS